MNMISHLRRQSGRFFGHLLTIGVSVWLLGVAFSPALAATTPNPVVGQSPLIIKEPLPPNIVLMLDDSGSMARDVMPDWNFLSSRSADALVSSDVNGVYFNPDITYTPPFKADGTSYPNAAFGSALVNGFDTGSAKVNLSTYDGSRDESRNGTSGSDIDYSFAASSANSYSAMSCGSFDGTSTRYPGYCYDDDDNGSSEFEYNDNYYYYRCNSHKDKSDGDTCYPLSFFTYTKLGSSGSYTRYYVAETAGDCAAAGLSSTVCDESAAKQQNVANWFSYYHTRMLLAKSGMMNAFVDVDAAYRVGFGSIGGSNTAGLGTAATDYYAFDTTDGSNTYHTGVAHVQPFGVGATAGSQKNKFWNWLVGTYPTSNTPLRTALDGVGKFYEQDQPWQSLDDDGNTVELTCRQSYTILTTDGFWNGSTPPDIGDRDGKPGATIAGPNLQTYTYAPKLPFSDGALGTTTAKHFYEKGKSRNSCESERDGKDNVSNYDFDKHEKGRDDNECNFDYTVTTGGGDSYSNTLADVAMKYWMTDLKTGLDNEVPTNDADPAFWQHMTTFTLGMGFLPVDGQGVALPSIDKLFAWATGGAAVAGFTGWPEPNSDSLKNIADLAHAGINGRGGFYSATDPTTFVEGVKDALARAAQRTGTGASLAANSTQLKTGAFAYQANYFTGTWRGDLKAIAVDPNNGSLAADPTWSAADPDVLPAAADRNIYTYNPSVSPVAAVAFKTAGDLSSDEQTALGVDATAQQNMIDYLRGDDAKERSKTGGIYRNRATPLGDIVDSQPVYVGQPDPNEFLGQSFTGSDSFATHAATDRQDLIYVAANDGMLHAFDADTGVEEYAYLPAAVITSGLATLADPDYGTTAVPHQFFNDGEMTVADVYFDTEWHSVLVGTTGRGLAKAVYALDVTDPTAITLLWERSAGDGKANADYIGQMTGKPVIAQTDDGEWSVLIGNGYNSTKGVSALLQFAIDDGTLSVHATTDTTVGNGLAAAAVWISDLTNGISTMAYAGDAHGQVWSFVLNASTTTTVDGLDVTTYASTPTSTGSKLYTTTDKATGGKVQPITGGMLIGKDPTTQDLWLFFGTGQYLSAADLTKTDTQTWYGLIVQSDTAGLAVTSADDRGDLKQRSIIAETNGTPAVKADPSADPPILAQSAIAPARALTPKPDTPDMTGEAGWYIDLRAPRSTTVPDDPDDPDDKAVTTYEANAIAQGERMVTPNQFQGNQLIATTRIPTATDLCNPSGRGWIMSVDPFTGTSPKSSFFDLNGDGLINQPADYIMVNGVAVAASGIGFNSLPNNPIFVGSTMLVSFDNGTSSSVHTAGSGGGLERVSWREVVNP